MKKKNLIILSLTMVFVILTAIGCGLNKDESENKDNTIETLRIGVMQSSDVIPLAIIEDQKLDEKYPKDDKIRLILDNLKVHSSQKVIEYLESNPGRFEFVFTPKHASWLNLIEGLFSKMTKQMLRGIRVSSKQELEDRIYKYFNEINTEPVVYHWGWNLKDVGADEDVKVQTLIS